MGLFSAKGVSRLPAIGLFPVMDVSRLPAMGVSRLPAMGAPTDPETDALRGASGWMDGSPMTEAGVTWGETTVASSPLANTNDLENSQDIGKTTGDMNPSKGAILA